MNYWAKTRESKLVFRSQLLLIVLAIAVSLFLSACLEQNVRNPSKQQNSRNGTEVLSEVVSISPLPTAEDAQRKRWLITLKVLQVVKGSPLIKQGYLISVQVHSVVKTFGDDADRIKGKKYCLHYADEFTINYTGEIAIFGTSESHSVQ